MYRVYYLDVAAIVVLFALLTSLFFRRMNRGRDNQAFIKYVVILLVLSIADILRSAPLNFLRPLSSSILFREIACSFYNFLNVASYTIYIHMVGRMTGTFRRIIRTPFYAICYALPLVTQIVLIIVNFSQHILFYYTRVGEVDVQYNRGEYLWTVIAIGYKTSNTGTDFEITKSKP